MTFLFFVVVVLTLLAVTALFLKKRLQGTQEPTLPKFTPRKPLTVPEEVLYHRLTLTLPEFVVLAQVQLTALMKVTGKGQQAWFNKISRKSVDYVICRKDFSVIAALELDDKSHNSEDRRQADADKNTAFAAAGIKLIRLKGMSLPSDAALKMMIERIAQEAA